YGLLVIDAETGRCETFPTPFPPGGDTPYASLLSRAGKYYTHFNSHFVEFDPLRRAFTFFQKTYPQMAMSMTEDDRGVIWSFTYPESGVVSFDPKTRTLKDYGSVYQQNWPQYPREAAADDTGWVYFGVGPTASQIIALDPATGQATPILADAERARAYASVYRAVDGKVYGNAGSRDGAWYELYQGEAKKLNAPPQAERKPIITGTQSLFYPNFPSGRVLTELNLVDRRVSIRDAKTDQVKTFPIEYESEGALIMAVAAAPDGTICGGTAFPMCFFRYYPKGDRWVNRDCYGQWNTVARQGQRFYVGGYGGGFLLEWDPTRDWVPTAPGNRESNPRHLAQVAPVINRPHELLAHPNGKTVVLAGTPGYGYTGGGLLFWDRETEKAEVLEHTQIIPDHSTFALVALDDDTLLGGTTTSPGTGGEKKAAEAELYVMGLKTKAIWWRKALFPGVQTYTDLILAPDGMVYGFADARLFFVFDPVRRVVVHQEDTTATLGPTSGGQGPRVFVKSPSGVVYVLFEKGIARVQPKTFRLEMLGVSPAPITVGGDLLEGRIYFASGSHLYSYQVP
ncbi:MAG: hypothetical protein QHJ73_05470, partial [Armatimonadota bacterium]|nr:hypothetical protein [Armatimonadota bacterium]